MRDSWHKQLLDEALTVMQEGPCKHEMGVRFKGLTLGLLYRRMTYDRVRG